MRSLVLIIAALLVSAQAWAADCTPEQLVRIRFSTLLPGGNPQSFAAQPKTLYRQGAKYGRIEELPDLLRGVHQLIVVSEPDIWVVNLAKRTGQHLVDPGPTFFFRAPLMTEKGSPFFTGLEFGCEIDYVKATGATQTRTGNGAAQYLATQGTESIVVSTTAGTDRVDSVRFMRDGKEVVTIRYLEYERLQPSTEIGRAHV